MLTLSEVFAKVSAMLGPDSPSPEDQSRMETLTQAIENVLSQSPLGLQPASTEPRARDGAEQGRGQKVA